MKPLHELSGLHQLDETMRMRIGLSYLIGARRWRIRKLKSGSLQIDEWPDWAIRFYVAPSLRWAMPDDRRNYLRTFQRHEEFIANHTEWGEGT